MPAYLIFFGWVNTQLMVEADAQHDASGQGILLVVNQDHNVVVVRAAGLAYCIGCMGGRVIRNMHGQWHCGFDNLMGAKGTFCNWDY